MRCQRIQAEDSRGEGRTQFIVDLGGNRLAFLLPDLLGLGQQSPQGGAGLVKSLTHGLEAGDVTTDRLDLGHAAGSVEGGTIHELHPAHLTAGGPDPVFDGDDRIVGRQSGQLGIDQRQIVRVSHRMPVPPQEFVLRFTEEAAIDFIHKQKTAVSGKPADHFGLILNDRAITFFTGSQGALKLMLPAHVLVGEDESSFR